MDQLKIRIADSVPALLPHWVELSDRIHANPETNFNEVKASRWLCEEFSRLGFQVEPGVGDIPTTFKASLTGKAGGPTVGIIIEYDALAGLGHACGHNTKGPAVLCGLEAFLRNTTDFRGKIVAFGCPAEEGGGGKVLMADRGVFNGTDVCLELGVGPDFATGSKVFARQGLTLTFKGKAGHAGLRYLKTVNALEALLYVLANLDYLRKHLGNRGLIHAVVIEGGKSPGAVPDLAVAPVNVRGLNRDIVFEYVHYIEDLCEVAAGAAGAKVEIEKSLVYLDYLKCPTLARMVMDNFKELGIEAEWLLDQEPRGSSDVGNVSHVVPTETIYIGIGHNLVPHTVEYREASGGEPGHKVIETGAKALAANLVDLLVQDSTQIVKAAKTEFEAAKSLESPAGKS